MNKMLLFLFAFFLLYSCKKEPGIGGNGSIEGKVTAIKFNATGTDSFFYPAADQYVYIVFGYHVGYDRRIKTDYNGAYRFSFLYPGKYTLYTYSSDNTGTQISGQMVVKKEIQLSKNQQFQMPEFFVYE